MENNDSKNIDVSHAFFMEEAIKEARQAYSLGEIPVGCVITLNGKIIGRGHNLKENLNDPSAHAEVIAIRQATQAINNWRLRDASLYITLEPCPMCTSLITQSRISQVFVAYPEFLSGALGSKIDLSEDISSHHKPEIIWQISEEVKELMEAFFNDLRSKKLPE